MNESDVSDRLRKRQLRKQRARKRILQSTAVLPGLCTISNGLAGFAAIHFATKDAIGTASLENIATAGWLIVLAMVFDVLDGRLARLTRRTSDFGGQLDSLCDVISFGVAPAILMLRMVITVLHGQFDRIQILQTHLPIERVVLCIAAIYVACTVLRLARFNVENEPDKSSHMNFRGLPSPGAAAAITALVLLFSHLAKIEQGWRSSAWMLAVVSITLPIITLIVAILMVSRFKYPHIVNQYIRGKRPFNYLVKLIIIIVSILTLNIFIPGAIFAVGYALSGPASALMRKVRRRPCGC